MSFLRRVRQAVQLRPVVFFSTVALLVVLLVFLLVLSFGRRPLSAALQAIFFGVPWLVLWYFMHRKNRRDTNQLAEQGRFRCLIRTPNAIKGSLSERWASGALLLSPPVLAFKRTRSAAEFQLEL